MSNREMKIQTILKSINNISNFNYNMIFGAPDLISVCKDKKIKHASQYLHKPNVDVDVILNILSEDGELVKCTSESH